MGCAKITIKDLIFKFRVLLGQCHEMDIFFKFKLFNQYFLFIRSWFPKSFKSFSPPYTIINFIFTSLKLLTNFDNAY